MKLMSVINGSRHSIGGRRNGALYIRGLLIGCYKKDQEDDGTEYPPTELYRRMRDMDRLIE
jgi:hypothetical protein